MTTDPVSAYDPFENDDELLERLAYAPADAAVDLDEIRRSTARFDADYCAAMLLNLRDLAAALSDAQIAVRARMVELLGAGGELELPGHGLFKVRKVSDRKEWDHALVAYRVAAHAVAHRTPDEDGSVERPEDVAVAAVLDAAGISYWKVGELKSRGIDPDTYCTKTTKGFTIELPPIASRLSPTTDEGGEG